MFINEFVCLYLDKKLRKDRLLYMLYEEIGVFLDVVGMVKRGGIRGVEKKNENINFYF